MVSSISNADSGIQQLMAQMYQKMGAADTDGTAGLSKKELASIDAGSDLGGAGFLNSLSAQFDKIDADGDGELTAKEISNAKPKEPMGPPPGLEISSSDSSESTNTTNSIDSFLDKILKSMMEKLTESTDSESTSKEASNDSKALGGLAAADTDGTAGLSAAELSAINTSSDAGKANFVNNLKENFAKIDTDGNGQLSQSEIAASKPSGPPPGAVASGDSSNSNSSGNAFANLTSSFVQKLLNSYQNGSLTSLASSLSEVF